MAANATFVPIAMPSEDLNRQVDNETMNQIMAFQCKFRKPIQSMQETIIKHQAAHQTILDKFILHEEVVERVKPDWLKAIQHRLKDAVDNRVQLEQL